MQITKAVIHPKHGVVTLFGYGISARVDRGHLILEDGVGPQRRLGRFSRVGHGLKRLVVIAKVLVRRVGKPFPLAGSRRVIQRCPLAGCITEKYQLLRMANRKRLKQDSVNESEDGCIRTDAKCQRNHCDGCKAFAFQQASEAVLKIFE